jgi:hypothetical protein
MAFRLSTGLRNALLDQKAVATTLRTSTDITFVDGGTSEDSIHTAGAVSFAAFKAGDVITISGAATSGNNSTFEIVSNTATDIYVATGSLTVDASAGEQIILASANGGSFVDLFRNCVIRVYSGAQPSGADSAETGTLLVTITESGGAFSGGSATNGLNFGNVSSGVLAMESGEVWQGTGLAAGTAGWFRCYANAYTTGASTSAVRFDGSVASSGAQFNMSNTTVSVGGTNTVDSVAITMPAA